MSCMDHHCIACDWTWTDNRVRGDCPMCGNNIGIGHHFDEDISDQSGKDTVDGRDQSTDGGRSTGISPA